MFKSKILFYFLLLISISATASHGNPPSGGKSVSMAGASLTNRDVWGAFNNQASLAHIRSITAGLIYENKFLLKELGNKAGVIALPINTGTFALSFNQFGFNLYNENKIGLAYAMPLSDKLSAGVQIDYLLTQLAENYGRKGVFTFELGLLAKISDKWYMGAHIYNPMRVKLTEYVEERIPSYISFGMNYLVSDKVNIVAEAEKDINHKPVFKVGIDYEIVKNIFIRTGVANNPSIFAFGFGVNMNNLKIDFGTSKHTSLGYSPAISLLYSFE